MDLMFRIQKTVLTFEYEDELNEKIKEIINSDPLKLSNKRMNTEQKLDEKSKKLKCLLQLKVLLKSWEMKME